jgi:molybdenum cofactor cytidylyltransferase
MFFGTRPVDQAEGCLLVHSLRVEDLCLKKGRLLSKDDIARLQEKEITQIVAAYPGSEEVHEDPAAQILADSVAGHGISVSQAFTGRANLMANAKGLVVIDTKRLQALNQIDESMTIATLPCFEPIEIRQMVATAKIIPFAVSREALNHCLDIAITGTPLIQVAPFEARQVGLVQTELPGGKASLLDKTKQVLDSRLETLECPPSIEIRCRHQERSVAEAISQILVQGAQLVIVSGASAIMDRRDVVPAGIVAAGGDIDYFGMPVDPGNLLLLAHHGEIPVLGMPGCARSPKLNGFDWVLQRLIANQPVGPEQIMSMGVGGLLKEIGNRPQPRSVAIPRVGGTPKKTTIGAIVLAAGQSLSRSEINPLLKVADGASAVCRTVRAAKHSAANSVLVVSGHDQAAITIALSEEPVPIVHNPCYAQGISTSLHNGLAALPDDTEGALILFGDTPVRPELINQLIAAFNPLEGRAICVPTRKGKRTNPLLVGRQFFAELQANKGDVGAKTLLASYPDLITEIAMPEAS